MTLLTLAQAAEQLGYSVSGLRKLLRSGRGPRFVRPGGRGHYRFRSEWLDGFVEQAAPPKRNKPARIEPACEVDRSLLNL